MDPGTLPSAVTLTLGMLGFGKSALTKVRILRQLLLTGRQTVVLDAQGENGQGEWADICQALNITPVAFAPGSAARINVLDDIIPAPQREQLLIALAEISCGQAMGPTQQYAIRRALNRLDEGAVLTELVAELHAESDTDADPTIPRIALSRYLDGDLAGLFDAPTQGMPDLDAPLIVFDFSAMDRNSPALPAVMAVLGAWLEHAWIRPDRTWRTLVIEEAWHLLATPASARLFQRLLKYSRRLHLSIDAVVHTLSDLNSEQAKDLVRLAGTRIIHQLPEEEARLVGTVCGLPAWAVKKIPALGIGEAIWQVGQTIDEVSCILSAVEEALVSTTKGREHLRDARPRTAVEQQPGGEDGDDMEALARLITQPLPRPRDDDELHAQIEAASEAGDWTRADLVAAIGEAHVLDIHGPGTHLAVQWIEVRAHLAALHDQSAVSCHLWMLAATQRLDALGQRPDEAEAEDCVDRAHHEWRALHADDPARAAR
ncbi:hypothetical protein AB0I84_49900, partial [Streptomyces spectabilis]|uniref:hypothetical protein n=1 Tax=Streptomyces spectabilis TaxID=68270 RepID=UPI0033D1EE09